MLESSVPELIYYCEFDLNNWKERLEITFSSEYVVTVNLLENLDSKIKIDLDIKSKKSRIPKQFFCENILNITAIAGKNGVGKTNVFKRIFYFESYLGYGSIKVFKDLNTNKFYVEKHNVEVSAKSNISSVVNDVAANPHNSILFYNVFSKEDLSYTSANELFVKPSQLLNSDSTLYFLLKNLSKSSSYKMLEGVSKFFKSNISNQVLSISFLSLQNFKNLQEQESALYKYAEDIYKTRDKYNKDILYQFFFILNLFEFELRINKVSNVLRVGAALKNDFQSVVSTTPLNKVITDIRTHLSQRSLLIVSPKIKLEDSGGLVFGRVVNKIINDFEKLPIEIKSISEGQLKLNLSFVEYQQNIFDFIMGLEVIKDNLFDIGEADLIDIFLGSYSAGEKQILYFFAAIFHKISNIESSRDITECKEKSIILVIDEYEQNLHPEWVRIFFSALIDFIEHMRLKDRRILFQIIFSTHSPYLISDLPKENIRLIKKDEKTGKREVSIPNHSFASNYYDILSDSFFLEDTIGEFAKQKINGWIKELNELEDSSDFDSDFAKLTRIDEIRELIRIVDDQFIRNKLLELVENVRNAILIKADKNLRASLIDQEIAKLEAMKKQLREESEK